MKYLFTILVPLFLLYGCVTQDKCNKLFPPQVVTKDSIVEKVSVQYKDTTIFLPGETVKVRDYVYCDSLNRAQLSKTVVKGKHLTAVVEIKDNKLSVDCQEDSLLAVNAKLKETILEKEKYSSKIETRIETDYISHWYDIAARWLLLIVIIGGFIYIKFFKK